MNEYKLITIKSALSADIIWHNAIINFIDKDNVIDSIMNYCNYSPFFISKVYPYIELYKTPVSCPSMHIKLLNDFYLISNISYYSNGHIIIDSNENLDYDPKLTLNYGQQVFEYTELDNHMQIAMAIWNANTSEYWTKDNYYFSKFNRIRADKVIKYIFTLF